MFFVSFFRIFAKHTLGPKEKNIYILYKFDTHNDDSSGFDTSTHKFIELKNFHLRPFFSSSTQNTKEFVFLSLSFWFTNSGTKFRGTVISTLGIIRFFFFFVVVVIIIYSTFQNHLVKKLWLATRKLNSFFVSDLSLGFDLSFAHRQYLTNIWIFLSHHFWMVFLENCAKKNRSSWQAEELFYVWNYVSDCSYLSRLILPKELIALKICRLNKLLHTHTHTHTKTTRRKFAISSF